MNRIRLKGVIQNIQESHIINDIQFSKAHMLVSRTDGKEDMLNIRFKKYANPYLENQEVSLSGNVRSYSCKEKSGKNKVELYVFTYFDIPELDDDDTECINNVELDGRICKIEPLRHTNNGKKNIHLIIANNLIVSEGSKKLNSYIPCIAWGELAERLSELTVNTSIEITGKLHSREYKKRLPDNNIELRVAHEVEIIGFEIL